MQSWSTTLDVPDALAIRAVTNASGKTRRAGKAAFVMMVSHNLPPDRDVTGMSPSGVTRLCGV
jgi:hypothetical protein